jgi:hypothetical protein
VLARRQLTRVGSRSHTGEWIPFCACKGRLLQGPASSHLQTWPLVDKEYVKSGPPRARGAWIQTVTVPHCSWSLSLLGPQFSSIILSFLGGVVLEFEFRTLHLQSKHSTTGASASDLFCFSYFPGRVSHFFPRLSLNRDPLSLPPYLLGLQVCTTMHQPNTIIFTVHTSLQTFRVHYQLCNNLC